MDLFLERLRISGRYDLDPSGSSIWRKARRALQGLPAVKDDAISGNGELSRLNLINEIFI
jgi:hypothetical protein